MLDPEGVITSWNPGAERFKGYTEGEHYRRALLAILHRGRPREGTAPQRFSRRRFVRASSRARAGESARTVAGFGPVSSSIPSATPPAILNHFSRFYTEEDRQNGEPERALATARREGRYEKESVQVRKNGERFWANVVLDAIGEGEGEGEVIGFAKITRDITEQRDARAAVALSRQLCGAHREPNLALRHAAATALRHSAVASARNIRRVDREMRWR